MSPRTAWDRLDPVGRVLLLVGLWAVVRTLLVLVPHADNLYPAQADTYDLGPYPGWGVAFSGGDTVVATPLRDGPWEYPAPVAAVLVGPAFLHGASYTLGFVAEMLLVDLVGLVVLLLVGHRRGSFAGAAWWVLAPLLLGPIVLSRFDVVAAVLAVGGLVGGLAGGPLTAGVLLGTGGALKLWPGLLLPLLLVVQPQRVARTLLGVLGVAVVVLGSVAAWGGLGQVASFLGYQRDRGLEVESVPANLLLLAHLAGAGGVSVSFGFGSLEAHGPYETTLGAVATLALALSLVGVGALAWRLRRAPDRVTAVCALSTLLLVGLLVTDKVLSTQYLLWLVGPVAVALTRPASPLRRLLPVLAPALLLTQWTYPVRFDDLVAMTPTAVTVLTVRNALLVVLAVQLVRLCLALPRTTAAPAGPPPPGDVLAAASAHPAPAGERQDEQGQQRG